MILKINDFIFNQILKGIPVHPTTVPSESTNVNS